MIVRMRFNCVALLLASLPGPSQRESPSPTSDAIESGNLEWEGALLAAYHQVNSIPPIIGNPERVNPTWDLAHDKFHSTLLEGCRSKWLKRFAATLRIQTIRYRDQSIQAPHAASRNFAQEHDDIVKAVLARDADRACELLCQHFAATTELVIEDIASDKPAKSEGAARGRTRARSTT